MSELPKPVVVLKVNGKSFEGFESGDVTLTMEDAVNSFTLNYVADGKNTGQRAIFPGDKCELLIGSGVVSAVEAARGSELRQGVPHPLVGLRDRRRQAQRVERPRDTVAHLTIPLAACRD